MRGEPRPSHLEFISVEVTNPLINNTYQEKRYATYEVIFRTNSLAFSLKHSIVRRRYSDFKWLRKFLSRTVDGKPPSLPVGRYYFGAFNEEYLLQRQKLLTDFMKVLVNHPNYMAHPALHFFLFTELRPSELEAAVKRFNRKPVTDSIAVASEMCGVHSEILSSHSSVDNLSSVSNNSFARHRQQAAHSTPNINGMVSESNRTSSDSSRDDVPSTSRSEPSGNLFNHVCSVGSFQSDDKCRGRGNSLRTREDLNVYVDGDWVVVKHAPPQPTPPPVNPFDEAILPSKGTEENEVTNASWVREDVDDITARGHLSQFFTYQNCPKCKKCRNSDIGPFRIQTSHEIAHEYRRQIVSRVTSQQSLINSLIAAKNSSSIRRISSEKAMGAGRESPCTSRSCPTTTDRASSSQRSGGSSPEPRCIFQVGSYPNCKKLQASKTPETKSPAKGTKSENQRDPIAYGECSTVVLSPGNLTGPRDSSQSFDDVVDDERMAKDQEKMHTFSSSSSAADTRILVHRKENKEEVESETEERRKLNSSSVEVVVEQIISALVAETQDTLLAEDKEKQTARAGDAHPYTADIKTSSDEANEELLGSRTNEVPLCEITAAEDLQAVEQSPIATELQDKTEEEPSAELGEESHLLPPKREEMSASEKLPYYTPNTTGDVEQSTIPTPKNCLASSASGMLMKDHEVPSTMKTLDPDSQQPLPTSDRLPGDQSSG